jgi:GntR family transcriptional repressor for pyruvate dehydrogenase complex
MKNSNAPSRESPGSGIEAGLRTPKRAELLARWIVKDIKSRRLPPGHMLPAEAEMISRYGVGRGTVREALRLLEAQGLVALKPGPGGGPVVVRLTPRQFGDMAKLHLQMLDATYEELVYARLAIEPLMARMAATNRDQEAADRLNEVIEEARATDIEDGEAYMAVSYAFHATIAGISNNRVLELMTVSLKEVMDGGVRPAFQHLDDRLLVIEAHEQIAEAVLSGRADDAEKLMQEHMKEYVHQLEVVRPGFLQRPIEWTLIEAGY